MVGGATVLIFNKTNILDNNQMSWLNKTDKFEGSKELKYMNFYQVA